MYLWVEIKKCIYWNPIFFPLNWTATMTALLTNLFTKVKAKHCSTNFFKPRCPSSNRLKLLFGFCKQSSHCTSFEQDWHEKCKSRSCQRTIVEFIWNRPKWCDIGICQKWNWHFRNIWGKSVVYMGMVPIIQGVLKS